MNHKEIAIITCKNKFFGQTRKPWSSLNVDKIAGFLKQNGLDVEVYEFHEIVNQSISLENKTIIYAFSQVENYREYIKDIMYFFSKRNRIIPSFDLLKCHENKGYQEIFKKEIGLNSLPARYYSSFDEVKVDQLKFPLVLKTTSGTNGKGVYLIKDQAGFNNTAKKLQNSFSLATRLDLIRRKYFRKKKFEEYPEFSDRQDYHEYLGYLKEEKNFILQEYIPDLDYDYRVLIAHNRHYVMKREVKKGDFRASGSKLFSFSKKPDKSLLNFSKFIYDKFDSPFLSVDILFDGQKYYLVEFQALHFGMSVVAKSEGFFQNVQGEKWNFVEEKPELEKLFANTFTSYLQSLPSTKTEG